ncbi:MAG: hypothetical protein ACRC0O_12705 [Vibrio metschnikovii]
MDKQSQTSQFQLPEQGIPLIAILFFMGKSWKIIFSFGLFGLFASMAFLWVTPSQYEAIAIIHVANVADDKNPLGVNVEEPAALISRMSLPTIYEQAVISACGIDQSPSAGSALLRVIKLTIPKGVNNAIELRLTRPSVQTAKACANSVFEQIASVQSQMLELIERRTKAVISVRLGLVEERLAQDKALQAKYGGPKNSDLSGHIALLSDIRIQEEEREKIHAIETRTNQTATLQSPVYVADSPVFPKKGLSLVAGLMGGLFLGVLIALVRQVLPKFKAQLQGAE